MSGVRLLLLALLVAAGRLAASSAVMAETCSFWVEFRGFSPQENEVLLSTLEQMCRRMPAVLPAARKEDADVILRFDAGGYAREEALGEALVGLSLESPDALDQIAEPSESGPTRDVRLAVVELLGGSAIYERLVRAQIPLVQGRQLSDAALRAQLSQAVREMADWAEARGREPALDFDLSADHRARLNEPELARALFETGRRAARSGFHEAALKLIAEAQPLLKKAQMRAEEGRSWEYLAFLMASTGRDMEKAIAYAGQSVRIAREVSDPGRETRALAALAAFEAQAGNYPRALEVAWAAFQMAQQRGDPLSQGAALATVAGVTALRGDYAQARTRQQEALELVRSAGSRPAEARLRLAMAAVLTHLDERDRSATLSEIEAVRAIADETGDLALRRDAAFVEADVRHSTTNLLHLREGEWAAVRALKLSRTLGDRWGEAASLALIGGFASRLGRREQAYQYLLTAQQEARERGFREILADSLELLGQIAPTPEQGISVLETALAHRREEGNLRRQAKILSDLSRLHSALEQYESAQKRFEEAVAAVHTYFEERRNNPFAEDIEASLVVVLKSLIATRTELPFLVRFLRADRMLVHPDPSWWEASE